MAGLAIRKLACSLTCGGLTLLLTYPFDLARTRLSLEFGRMKSERTFKKCFQAMSETRARDGFKGLYRGFLLSNLINVPYTIQLYTFMSLLVQVGSAQNGKGAMWQRSLEAAGIANIAGLLAMVVIYPMDTIR